MISNLAVTTPVVGTIRLGDVAVSQKGKRYPVRTNHFKITAQFKDAEGRWVEHPMHRNVARKHRARSGAHHGNPGSPDVQRPRA